MVNSVALKSVDIYPARLLYTVAEIRKHRGVLGIEYIMNDIGLVGLIDKGSEDKENDVLLVKVIDIN